MPARLTFVVLDSFFPPAHGGAHMIRTVAEGLARLGHAVRVILLFEEPEAGSDALTGTAQTAAKLARLGVPPRRSPSGTLRFEHNGVSYAGVERASDRFLPFVASELRAHGTDAVILSDVGGTAAHVLLRHVRDTFDGLIVYYPMTVHMLPGGPLTICADAEAARLLASCRAVAPSRFSADYIARHLGASARACIPPMFDMDAGRAGAPADFGSRFGLPIALFNPNTWKGLPILLGLADRRPNLQFLVRAAWRTTEADLLQIRGRSNIVVHHQQVGATDSVYSSASAVLVPSLCCESLGLIPIEAMLRGLPSLASEHGGLKEAALGLPFSLPVNPIVLHRDPADPCARPREEIPEQPLEPWLEAVDRIAGDPAFYADLSLRAWQRARSFTQSLSWDAVAAAFLD